MQSAVDSSVFIHPAAICEAQGIGAGTRIWAFAHILDGAVIGCHCNICDHVFIENGARLGDGVIVKNGAMIWDGVTLEDHVFIGPGAIFTNDRHPRSRHVAEAFLHNVSERNWLVPTMVRRGASIGAGAVIVCGVTIGSFAAVGAGAIVTRDVADYRLVVGQPAKPVGWVCRCGVPLDPHLDCPQCDLRYQLSSGRLVLQE